MSAKIAFKYNYNEQVNTLELEKILTDIIVAFFPPADACSTTYCIDIAFEQDQMISSILNTALLHYYIKSALSAQEFSEEFKVFLCLHIYRSYGCVTPQPILLREFQEGANFSLKKNSEDLLHLLLNGFLDENIRIAPVLMKRYTGGSFRLYRSQWNETLNDTFKTLQATISGELSLVNDENKTVKCLYELAKMF